MRWFTRLAPVTALIALPGCYSEDNFREDLATSICDLEERCGFLDDYGSDWGECYSTWAEDMGCDDYHRGSAKECLETFPQVSCDGWFYGTSSILDACEDACSGG